MISTVRGIRSSMFFTPEYVLKCIKKYTSKALNATFEDMPMPNHSRNNGANAIFGIEYNALKYGATIRSVKYDRPRIRPVVKPVTPPIRNPSRASLTVIQVFCRIPSQFSGRADKILDGAGRNNSRTWLRAVYSQIP